MGKKELNVCDWASTKMLNTNLLFAILGWLLFFVGCVLIFIGIFRDEELNIAGCVCIASTLHFLVIARVFLALHVIVLEKETRHAINNEN